MKRIGNSLDLLINEKLYCKRGLLGGLALVTSRDSKVVTSVAWSGHGAGAGPHYLMSDDGLVMINDCPMSRV